MKISEILTPSFRSLREQLGFSKERKPMVESCQASMPPSDTAWGRARADAASSG